MAKAQGMFATILVALPLILSGCAALRGDLELLASGPAQQFDAASITTFANNQELVLAQVQRLAGLTAPPKDQGEWRTFVTAGFDFADSQCEAYMAAVRRLDIARRRTVQQTSLAGGATAGIVGAASSAIAITAIAFGLAAASIDNVTGGLLYELPPSTIRELVMRTREAYEGCLKPADWQDRPSSFRTIRGYVELCLPAVIEAHAAAAIRAAEPTPFKRSLDSGGGLGGPPRLQMGPLRARDPVPPTPAPAAVDMAGNRQGAGEDKLTRTDARAIQAALCMPPDKQVGTLGPETRAAITEYRAALGSQAAGGLAPSEVTSLLGAGTCGTQYQNAFERFAYPTPAAVTRLQRAIATALGGDTTVPTGGVLDAATREAIKRLQKNLQLPETGAMTFAVTQKMAP